MLLTPLLEARSSSSLPSSFPSTPPIPSPLTLDHQPCDSHHLVLPHLASRYSLPIRAPLFSRSTQWEAPTASPPPLCATRERKEQGSVLSLGMQESLPVESYSHQPLYPSLSFDCGRADSLHLTSDEGKQRVPVLLCQQYQIGTT